VAAAPRTIDSWKEAELDLGVPVSGPLEVQINDQISIHADMLVQNFGGRLGTIVVADYASVEPYRSAILAAGYAWSCFGPPTRHEPYDRESVIEVLMDWTWSGPPEDAPTWYRSRVAESAEPHEGSPD
jgi:hypothetical protein